MKNGEKQLLNILPDLFFITLIIYYYIIYNFVIMIL